MPPKKKCKCKPSAYMVARNKASKAKKAKFKYKTKDGIVKTYHFRPDLSKGKMRFYSLTPP